LSLAPNKKKKKAQLTKPPFAACRLPPAARHLQFAALKLGSLFDSLWF